MISTPFPVFIAAAALLGLVLGSFCGVCITRYLRGESVVSPPSHCPACGRRLRPWELIPVLSWLALRGRCAGCGRRIGIGYPCVELVTACAASLLAWRFGPGAAFAAMLALSCAFIIASGIDALSLTLPDRYTLGTALPAFLCAVFLLGIPWAESLAGGLAGAGIFLALSLLYRQLRGMDGLGMGDVKLMLPLGFLTGIWLLPALVLIAALAGLAVSLPLFLLLRRDPRSARVPFGPFLCLGAFACAVFGDRLLEAWLGILYGISL